MKTLGLDIGTTTISAVVYDTDAGVLTSRTIKNDSFLTGESWERIQDPSVIWEKSVAVVQELLREYPDVTAMGLSGQMHGILYLDAAGTPVSPLYIWQDGRGDLPYDETHSWAAHLSELTGYSLATGYGLVTHCYNLNHGLVPKNAVKLCTIHDYLAMKFSGRSTPVTEATDAASLGLYDGPNHRFDPEALQKAGIDPAILPEVVTDPCLGTGMLGIPVYAALGDNQASFLGATGGRTDVLLVNMGTGGQVSVYSPEHIRTQTLETRPFPDGGWLLVGASLCGGRSYALLETFFRETVKMVTGQEVSAYEAMSNAMGTAEDLDRSPKITTLFQGTRKDPSLRGSIENIGTDNFTPRHFIRGVMQGMAEELYGMYQGYLAMGGKPPAAMVGSGNGLRKNPHLCRVFEKTFGIPLILSENDEEAACGAAIYAAKHR
ncbi:MAG: hypothetical protein IKY96_04945 [Oscillospiraceae bacterium]|nr:hypothetical protein [Oscillospiraceae bacterium]